MAPETVRAATVVFGERPSPVDIRQWAAQSDTEFVRTQYTLSVANPEATGVRLKALEALDQYGWDTLSKLADHYSVPLIRTDGEPFATLRRRASEMGLDLAILQAKAGWTDSDAENFDQEKQVGFRKIDSLAALLGIQSKQLGLPEGGGEDRLGARLRTLSDEKNLKISPDIVLIISEASRITSDFIDLRKQFSDQIVSRADEESIGDVAYIRDAAAGYSKGPPWRCGFECADAFRAQLGLSSAEPVRSISRIVEFGLDALLIRVKTKHPFTGCAIQRGRERAILINTTGSGSGVVTQRSAMAHELGHYLMDHDDELNNVRVDQDRVFDNNIAEKDRVESRANAFAAQLLAPQDEVVRMYDNFGKGTHAIVKIMAHYGVSQTVVRWQLNNSPLGYSYVSTVNKRSLDESAWAKWGGRENQISCRMGIFGARADLVRLNKLGLLACKLYQLKKITLDSLTSLLGYPKGNVAALSEDILNVNFLNVFYRGNSTR